VRELDIKTLCEQAGVTSRTVHFYVQQGLLPPASSAGPGARYTEGHLKRLQLVRLLQRQHLPLAEIARRLKGLTDDQVGQLLDEARARRPAVHESALDYIRGVLGETHASRQPVAKLQGPLRQLAYPSASSASPVPGLMPERSQWERFALTDSLELHVRRPLSRMQQRQLDRLLAAAKDIFDRQQEE
jgi:DNA-binding transcriptional MerR regulator